MPEKTRVVVCGFDPMIVKGYVKTGERALWWHISDELYDEYQVKPGATVSGKLLAVYHTNTGGGKTSSSNEPFEWKASKGRGLAVVLPPEVITRHQLTEFHFLELLIEKVDGQAVWPGQEKINKWWPDDKMTLEYTVAYQAP